MAPGIANEDATADRHARQKIFQGTAVSFCFETRPGPSSHKPNAPFAISIAEIEGAAVPKFTAKAKSMPSTHVGHVIAALQCLVRCCFQGQEGVSAKRRKAEYRDLRQAKIAWISDAGIDAITLGTPCVVDRHDRLPEAIEAKLGFVGPA